MSMKSPRTLLGAEGLRPRKSMGQHFLADPHVAASIVSRARLKPDDVVLEIGAGLGALTLPLATQVAQVFAVESDPRIAAILRHELSTAGAGNVTIVEKDILLCDLEAVAESAHGSMTVAGNLPYHISSQVLLHLIRSRKVIRAAFLMFQKEVADRLTAGPGSKSYGRLSVRIQYCARIYPLLSVGAKAFFPPPKVDSRVVGIEFEDPVAFPAADESLFVRIVRAAFGQRRKMLRNALLAGDLGFEDQTVSAVLTAAGIDGKRRAETLSVEEFVRLSNRFHEQKPCDPRP
jgi:16S rRNA (adenine1518-N6/adenine1519-N6)-dimethyltransferase